MAVIRSWEQCQRPAKVRYCPDRTTLMNDEFRRFSGEVQATPRCPNRRPADTGLPLFYDLFKARQIVRTRFDVSLSILNLRKTTFTTT